MIGFIFPRRSSDGSSTSASTIEMRFEDRKYSPAYQDCYSTCDPLPRANASHGGYSPASSQSSYAHDSDGYFPPDDGRYSRYPDDSYPDDRPQQIERHPDGGAGQYCRCGEQYQQAKKAIKTMTLCRDCYRAWDRSPATYERVLRWRSTTDAGAGGSQCGSVSSDQSEPDSRFIYAPHNPIDRDKMVETDRYDRAKAGRVRSRYPPCRREPLNDFYDGNQSQSSCSSQYRRYPLAHQGRFFH